ncbi:hypothetical protein V5N11_021813 [Cardamine amara subsp. amara]|uniref:DUF4218 domain-containing protein n=1 Tax=Cardamine amara subsp. amara TaxID=228776 RepID=A0ABD1AU08_CARAN
MIFWREDANLESCRFCGEDRFQVSAGMSRIPYQRMWYLPIADRLKRLYQSERTAKGMRWHGEHSFTGDISHPSDAEAWKHFRYTYPDFAREIRNVYLGLSTDGFNPFGKGGRKYSLWPVIVTPYNLPPALCMKREFLFLTILVPGPNHPRRALDVFLKPLISELQMLWYEGVRVYDVSLKNNFTMRAVLMWTISDFPAYGMLSGWTTHGRLSCPHCQDNSDAFWLQNGRKSSWFDCHRRFLPSNHPYRRNKRLFTKNKVINDGPPPSYDGTYILEQFSDFYVLETRDCGGNGHDRIDGYGTAHNWHKKSIFWELPYWKDHILRHNLDVMHIEKNFFENIINTVLNVAGKTKDNLKSRLDLQQLCGREELYAMENGTGQVPIFRLLPSRKAAFFEWLQKSAKFPDGYVSNLSNCVDETSGRLSGLKSHDCHVIMERLFPFVFDELLPKNVHEPIAAIGAFFRDLCSRSLTESGLHTLQQNIPVILCNLEKIFPPSFFDVMEHLPIHLPREAVLGGPVQYRWMYPFERYMFHLKKKVKNMSKVEGSIVAQSLNEEITNFSAYYFAPTVQTKARKPGRYDDGGERPTYHTYVPSIFQEIGQLSGKRKGVWLTEQEVNHIHCYIIRNCEDVFPYESIFADQLRAEHEGISDEYLEELKQSMFPSWLKYYVSVFSKCILNTLHCT